MTTYVLVHGAWGGAHGFRHVRPLLRSRGHDVFTPSLTGIGERSHLTGPLVSLSTHVTDVVNTVLYEDLHDLVLLGFSYGGAVVTGSLAHIGERVRHLVYLDAFVPRDGESIMSLRTRATPDPMAIGAEWQLPPMPRAFDDPAEAEFSNPRRSLQPIRTFTEAVRLPTELEELACSLTYIKATADETETPDSAFWAAAARARSSSRWNYHEIATNHMVPSNRPAELADILLALG